jgi:hypothetical protein
VRRFIAAFAFFFVFLCLQPQNQSGGEPPQSKITRGAMGAGAKFLLRLFLWTAVPFGTLVGLCVLFLTLLVGPPRVAAWAPLVGLVAALGAGVLYGVVLAAWMGGWHLRAVKKLGFPITDETLRIPQERTLTLDAPFAEAFTACLGAVRALPGTAVLEETDYQQGVIEAVKGVSWSSWGEKIRFELRETTPGHTRVTIRCRPALSTTLADFGVSLRNMDTLVSQLLAQAPGGQAPELVGRAQVKLPGQVRGEGEPVQG